MYICVYMFSLSLSLSFFLHVDSTTISQAVISQKPLICLNACLARGLDFTAFSKIQAFVCLKSWLVEL